MQFPPHKTFAELIIERIWRLHRLHPYLLPFLFWSIEPFLYQWNSVKPLVGLCFASIVSATCAHSCTGVFLQMHEILTKWAPNHNIITPWYYKWAKLHRRPLISNMIVLFHYFHDLPLSEILKIFSFVYNGTKSSLYVAAGQLILSTLQYKVIGSLIYKNI